MPCNIPRRLSSSARNRIRRGSAMASRSIRFSLTRRQAMTVSGAALSAASFGAPRRARGETITFKLGHVDNPSTPAGVALEAFATEVKRLSNGEMEVQVFHAGQLVTIPEEVKNVLSGAQDMHMFSPEI